MESIINLNRKIGIEIEVVVPIIGRGENQDVQNLIAEVLTNQGIKAVSRGYTQRALPHDCKFAIEHDMSLQDESRYHGLRWSKIEAKTCPMTWEDVERIVPPALEIIRYVGARCNVSTGLHVHHHLPEVVDRPQIVRSLQHLWWRFHPIMYGMLARSRKSCHYCPPPQQDDATIFDSVGSYEALCGKLNGLGRYEGLNFANLNHGHRMTVEWRIHGGTTDWEKIKAWVLATQRWTEHAIARSCHYKPEPISNTLAGLNALLVTTGLKGNSRIYNKVQKELREVGRFLVRRWKHFNLPQDYKSDAAAA